MRALLAVLLVAACAEQDPTPIPSGPDATPDPSGPDAEPLRADGPTRDSGPTYACAPDPIPGHQEITCDGGVEYDVEASADCAAGGCGLILDIHGFIMSGDELDAHTRMRALASPLGYVVVQPTAPGFPASWAGGGYDEDVWTFVEATAHRFDIDRDRIHVMGFSQGGEMTLRLLCAHAEDIASVAPAAGSACFDGGAPAVEVPILYMHGTADLLINYDLVAEPLRDAVVETWSLGDPQVMAQSVDYTAERWENAGGTVFELWTHDFEAEAIFLGGHCLPGPVSDETYRCRDDGQFDHSLEALRFFTEHPR